MTNETNKAIEEAIEVIADGKEELIETKKVIFDKKTGQCSIKIPKSLALKAGLTNDSEINIIVNPKNDTIKNIKSNIVIIKKSDKNGDGEKSS